MANIDVNITEMTSNCESLASIKGENDLNIKGKTSLEGNSAIKELGIIYFDGLDSYVDALDASIDKYKNAMTGYVTSLTGVSPYETTYVPEYPSINTPKDPATDVDDTEESSDATDPSDTKDTDVDPSDVSDSDNTVNPDNNRNTNEDVSNAHNSGRAKDPDNTKNTDSDPSDVASSSSVTSPDDTKDTETYVSDVDYSGDVSEPEDTKVTETDVSEVDPSGGTRSTYTTKSSTTSVDSTSTSSVSTGADEAIAASFDILNTGDSEGAKTLANLVTTSLSDVNHIGDTSNATLLGAVGGAISNISGAGLAGIAGVLGGIGAIAATVAAASTSSSSSGTSLTDVMSDKPNYGGVALSSQMQQFIGGVISGATGISVSELLSGTYPEALETGNNVFNSLMSMFKEAGNVTKEDFTFALNGEPYSFRNLTKTQKEKAFIIITSLVDKYGSIDDLLLHSEEVISNFQKIGSSYSAVKTLLDMNPQEICDALRGLFDKDNPNIGGISITPEARDFIKNYLEQFTGISLEELLDGNHNEEIKNAIESLLEILELYNSLGEMSKEEFEKYINDLLKGKFREVCGINTFTVKSFKSFLASVGIRNRLNFNVLLQNKAILQSAIKEYSGIKEEIRALHSIDELEIQEALKTFFSTGRLATGGMQLGSNSKMIIKFMFDAVCKYNNISFDELLNNTENGVVVYSYIYELYKYVSFIKIYSKETINKLHSGIIKMFQGKEMGLLGIGSDQMVSVKNTIENYCKDNNIQLRAFFNNISSYPIVMELLKENDTFIRINIIFDDLKGLPLLLIIHNLLESWKEDFKDRMNNVVSFLNRKRLENIITSTGDGTKEAIKVVNKENVVSLVNSLFDKTDEELIKLLGKIFNNEKNELDKDASGISLCYLIRIYLFGLSSYYKISVEDLLKDSKYSNYVKFLLKYVPYYLSYIKYEDLFDDRYLFKFTNDLYVGKYPLLLGYTREYLTPIEREYVTIANYKNLNIKTYLSNSMYALEVAQVMKKNPQSFFVSFFGDKNDYVLQTIIYNIFSNYRK